VNYAPDEYVSSLPSTNMRVQPYPAVGRCNHHWMVVLSALPSLSLSLPAAPLYLCSLSLSLFFLLMLRPELSADYYNVAAMAKVKPIV
jgi:hypothetical protein